LKRPSIGFFSSRAFYLLGVSFYAVSREMFAVRIFRTMKGSAFRDVDVIVLDEETDPFDLEGYMTALQAKREQRALIRKRKWLRRRRLEKARLTKRFRAQIPVARSLEEPEAMNQQDLSTLPDSKSSSFGKPTVKLGSIITSDSQLKDLNSDERTSSISVDSSSTHQKTPESLPRRQPLFKLHSIKAQRFPSKQTRKSLPPEFLLETWKTASKTITHFYSRHFCSTAQAFNAKITTANTILAAWKQCMLSENGFGLIRIPGPQPGIFVPKRCVLVPAWVKRTVGRREYGEIVRGLCEFALEQWSDRRLYDMAARDQERVQELFLLPDGPGVMNPFLELRLSDMNTMFKKWKLERAVEDWAAKSASMS
jgi:hypothetical protein